MPDEGVQLKFGGETADLETAVKSIADTVKDAFARMRQACDDLSSGTKEATSQIVDSNKKAQESTESMASKMQTSIKQARAEVTAQLGGISTAITKMTGVFASLTAVMSGGAAFKEVIGASQRWTGEVVALSKALGMTTEAASGLNMALRLNGLQSDEYISMSMKMLRAVRQNGDQYEALGMKVKEVGNDQNRMFQEAIRWIGSATEGTERNTRAQMVFQKAAEDAAKYQKLTNEALAEGTKRAQEHNLVVGKDGVAAYKAYQKQLNEMKVTLDEVKVQIGRQVLPAFIDLGRWLTDTGPKAVVYFAKSLSVLAIGLDTLTTGIKNQGIRLAGVFASAKVLKEADKAQRKALWDGDIDAYKAIGKAAQEADAAIQKQVEADLQAADDAYLNRINALLGKMPPKPPSFEPTAPQSSTTSGPIPTVADFDKTLKDLKNLEKNWYTWSADEDLDFRKKSYEWAVAYYGKESALAKELWDKYSDAARAAHKTADTGKGSASSASSAGDGEYKRAETEINEFLMAERAAGADTKQAELQLWTWKLEEAQKGTQLYEQVLKKVAQLQQEVGRQQRQEAEQAAKEQKKVDEVQNQGRMAHAVAGLELEKENIRQRRTLEQIGADEEIRLLQEVEDRQYQIELSALYERLAIKNLEPQETAKIYAQIEALQDQHGMQMLQGQHKIEADTLSSWKRMLSPVTSALSSALSGLLKGTMSLKDAVKNVLGGISDAILNAALDWVGKWIWSHGIMRAVSAIFKRSEVADTVSTEAVKVAAVTAGEQAQVAAKTAGAAEGKAVEITTGLSSIMKNAYKAAAGAYAAVVEIPIIGPILAPIAAAISFAAVAAFGGGMSSAAGGWDEVPSDQMAMIHKKEMILSPGLAERVRSLSDPVAMIQEAMSGVLSFGAPRLALEGGWGIPGDRLAFFHGLTAGDGFSGTAPSGHAGSGSAPRAPDSHFASPGSRGMELHVHVHAIDSKDVVAHLKDSKSEFCQLLKTLQRDGHLPSQGRR